MADNVVWIVIAVVAVLALVGVALLARSRRHTRLHGEAQRIRDEVEQESVGVDRRAALAQETSARARAARAEAEARRDGLVAELAGLPAAVTKRAKSLLKEMESRASGAGAAG